MKILIIHNEYRLKGGEDSVVKNEERLLRQYGHTVEVVTLSNLSISGLKWVKVVANIIMPWHAKKQCKTYLNQFSPDVVHIHNYWPLVSPWVHHFFLKRKVPVIQTLHNYRLVCVGAQFLRNGSVCTKCVDSKLPWGVIHRCYRQSVFASAAVFMYQKIIKAHGWFAFQRGMRFICLTRFARDMHAKGGIQPKAIVTKSNFFDQDLIAVDFSQAKERTGVLFVGRLSEEKGIDIILRAAEKLPKIEFLVAGDGPLRVLLEAENCPANVRFLGPVSGGDVLQLMSEAKLLLVPSVWFEGFPMTVIEAYANGLPVIASDIGSLSEIVEPEVTGLLVEPGDANALASAIGQVYHNDERLRAMGRAASDLASGVYSKQESVRILEGAYTAATTDFMP